MNALNSNSEKKYMILLTVFQITWVLVCLSESTHTAYRLCENGKYTEYSVSIVGVLLLRMALLILVEWFLFWLFRNQGIPTVSILVPLSILMMMGIVFQTYVRTVRNSWLYFIFLLTGLLVLVLAMELSHRAVRVRPDGVAAEVLLLILLLVSSVYLVYCLAAWLIPALKVNGSAAEMRLFGISIQPCEIIKLLSIFFVSTGYLPLRIGYRMRLCGFKLKSLFWLTSIVSMTAVFLSTDFGNLIILLLIYLVLILSVEGGKTAVLFLGGSAAVSGLGWGVYCWFVSHVDWFSDHFGYVATRVNAVSGAINDPASFYNSSRKAFMAVYRSGIFGSGLGKKMYGANVYAVHTDYVFSAICSIFGVVTAWMVIGCFAALLLNCRIRRQDAGNCLAVYTLSNMLTAVIGMQVLLHCLVNMNLLPFTGVVLPWISAGGTGMWTGMACLGLALGPRMKHRMIRIPNLNKNRMKEGCYEFSRGYQ